MDSGLGSYRTRDNTAADKIRQRTVNKRRHGRHDEIG